MRELGAVRGFAIVELLLVTMVSTLRLVGVSSLVVQGQSLYGRESSAIDVRQSTRVPLIRLAREIRMAGYEIGTLPQAVLRASATSVAIAADLDAGDPGGACAEEKGSAGVEGVFYVLQAGRLERGVRCWDGSTWQAGVAASLVVDNVQTQRMFRYFAADGTELVAAGSELGTAERDLIASITIELDVTDEPPAGIESTIDKTVAPESSLVPSRYPTTVREGKSARAAVRARVVLRNARLDPTPTKGS